MWEKAPITVPERRLADALRELKVVHLNKFYSLKKWGLWKFRKTDIRRAAGWIASNAETIRLGDGAIMLIPGAKERALIRNKVKRYTAAEKATIHKFGLGILSAYERKLLEEE